MKYYAAQLIYKIADNLRHADQYLIELRMLCAADEREALAEARRLGQENGPVAGVQKQFIGVKSLEEIDLHSGAVVFRELREYSLAESA